MLYLLSSGLFIAGYLAATASVWGAVFIGISVTLMLWMYQDDASEAEDDLIF